MALDPAPTVTALPVGSAAIDPTVEDDPTWLRRTAQWQWAARRDLERRLHDGAALRVSALTLRLGMLRHLHPGGDHERGDHERADHERGEHEFRIAVEDLQDELHLVLQELRDIAGRLYPPLLDEAGLGPALREAAGRCPAPVRVDAPDERFGPDVEGAVYFAVLGCLPDEPGPPVEIEVRRDGDDVIVLVTGIDACQTVVSDGVRLLGGTVVVGPESDAASDTAGIPAITVRVPCA